MHRDDSWPLHEQRVIVSMRTDGRPLDALCPCRLCEEIARLGAAHWTVDRRGRRRDITRRRTR